MCLCVRVRREVENNSDITVELEPSSIAVVRGYNHRGNTTHVTSKKCGGGGKVDSDAWNYFKKS